MYDDFEQHLTRTPLRSLPPKWRQDILHAATQAAAIPTSEMRRRPAAAKPAGWWNTLWLRFPLPTMGLAAAWAVVFLSGTLDSALNGRSKNSGGGVSQEQMAWARAQRSELWLLAGFSDTTAVHSEPSPATQPPRAVQRPRSDRKRDDDDRFGFLHGNQSELESV
jgi:hypothetical protein